MIDLFKSRRKNSIMLKEGGYVKARSFNLDDNADLTKIYSMTNCRRKEIVDDYINHIYDLIERGRHYDDIGYDLSSDSLFEVEALGIGKYAKRYQIIISFEDCLDYFLHAVTGCDIDTIRNVKGYHEISSVFMELRTPTVESEIKFNSLFNIDKKLDDFFIAKEKFVRDQEQYYGDEFVNRLAYEIETAILREVSGVQNYIIAAFGSPHSSHPNAVCRSRSFSSLIFTDDKPMSEELTLNYEGHGSLTIMPRCFEKYEYATKEVLVCDRCRKC